MGGCQRNVGVLVVVTNVLLTTQAQWLYQYPSQTHNRRYKLPQNTHHSPDRSYQTLRYPSNQPVRSHESVQSSTQFPIQMHQTPYYSRQKLVKLQDPATHPTPQPSRSWQPTKPPTQQPATLQQPAHHLTPKPKISQEPMHNTTHWPVTSQQPAYDPSKQPGWSQQHAYHPFQQPVRSQQPTHHSTKQPVVSQQPTHHPSQQPVRSQQHRHYPPQQFKSKQPTHYSNLQPIRSQQPTRQLAQQSIRSQQPTYHLTQQSSQQPNKSKKPVHHFNQQSVKSHQPAHPPPQHSVRSQQPAHHLHQKPQYHHAQSFDRRHQPAWYWDPYRSRYYQQWPQSTQAPHRPGHGKERFDTGQVRLTNPNTSIADSTSSPTTQNSRQTITTSRTLSTDAPATPTNSISTTEKTTTSTTNLSSTASTILTTITSTSNTFPTESKPETTTPTIGITSTSPSTTEITTIKIPITTKMAITSFLPTTTITTSKPKVSVKGKEEDLENAFATYNTTMIPPAVTDAKTSTKTTTSSPWPFTMKPVQLIVKTQRDAQVSSPKSLTTNNTQDVSYMDGNMGGKFEKESVEELSNPSNVQISLNAPQKVCCESKDQENLPSEESQLTEVLTTLLPLEPSEDQGSDSTNDIPQYNHDLVTHENTATTVYPIEKIVTSLPEDNNNTHLHSAKDIPVSLPGLSVSPHGEYSASPPSSKGGDSSLLSKNNANSQILPEKDILLPSQLLTDDTSTSPVEETILTPPAQRRYASSLSTWRGYDHPKPTRVIKVAFGPQTTRDPNQSHSPLELPVRFKNPYQIEDGLEAIIIPAGNQTLPKKVKSQTTNPQQNSFGPQSLPVQQSSPAQRLLLPGFLRNQHVNHPSPSKNQFIHTNSSQGILPQFNPASGVKFELSKLKEAAAESNTKDVLPQFNPTSGLIFPLTESTNGTNTVHTDSGREIKDASLDLQPDPFHIVAGPSLHFGNESYNSEAEENTTTPVTFMNIFDTVPIPVSNIKTTTPTNSDSSATPLIMSLSSVHTAPSEVAETAQDTITSTSHTASYENITNNPPLMFAGFLQTETELMMNPENQRSNNQPNVDGKNENTQDTRILSQARKGYVKPVSLDATDTTNTGAEDRMELGNTSAKSIPTQNVEDLEENIAAVLPYMPPFHSVVPSHERFLSLDKGKHIVTEASNAAEAMVSSKANSQQQTHLRPPYLQGFAQGLRQKPALIQSTPPGQEPWRPLHDKPSPATHFSSESPDLRVQTQPLLSKEPSGEVNFSPSEAEIPKSIPLSERSQNARPQNLPLSQRLSGLPPIPQNTPMLLRPHDLALPSRPQDWSLPPRSPTQSQDFPLLPRLHGHPLPTKPQYVPLSLRLQKLPHPTRPQNVLSQKPNHSPSPLRKQALPLSKRPQYLFSTPGPLHLSLISRPQNFQGDLYSSLHNSTPQSTILNETLGQQSQVLSQGSLSTKIKEKSPPQNLESSQDHKLPQTSQYTLYTTDQVHEPIIAAGTRHVQSESNDETLQRTHPLASDKLSITKLYKGPSIYTPASHDSTSWPTLGPIFHRPSLFASQIPHQSELQDSLLIRQSNDKDFPVVQSTASLSLTPQVTSTATTLPAANEQNLSSRIRNDKLVSDILNTLPDSLRGSVRVDEANLRNHNNVAVSNSYGNVVYQQERITFIGGRKP